MTPRNTANTPLYLQLLQRLKTCFPGPVSEPVQDGYFVHTISRFLDRVDDLKSAAPILGRSRQAGYQDDMGLKFPEETEIGRAHV